VAAPIHLTDSTTTYLEFFLTGVPLAFFVSSMDHVRVPQRRLDNGGKPVPASYLGPQGQFLGFINSTCSCELVPRARTKSVLSGDQGQSTVPDALGSSGVILDIEQYRRAPRRKSAPG